MDEICSNGFLSVRVISSSFVFFPLRIFATPNRRAVIQWIRTKPHLPQQNTLELAKGLSTKAAGSALTWKVHREVELFQMMLEM